VNYKSVKHLNRELKRASVSNIDIRKCYCFSKKLVLQDESFGSKKERGLTLQLICYFRAVFS